MTKKHKCPSCGNETVVNFETNRRICRCGWCGDIVGGKTSGSAVSAGLPSEGKKQ